MSRFPKISKIIFLLLCAISYVLSPSPIQAEDPFPPFSVEGNPSDDYQFEQFFPLYRYIPPYELKVFENMDFDRSYEPTDICSPEADRRDKYCEYRNGSLINPCEGGEVDMCYKSDHSYARTASSQSGNCETGVSKEEMYSSQVYPGICKYTQVPAINTEIAGTDFSINDNLIYPKYQSKSLRYSNIGSPNNPITWGSHYLAYNQCERMIKQLLVVTRAKETKTTVSSTGEWPLGWVDWGYITQNGKTLLQIHDSLPGTMNAAGKIIAEGTDDFYLNAGNLDAVSDVSDSKQIACDQFLADSTKGLSWTIDLSQAPIYAPSFRQGFVRPSICIQDFCFFKTNTFKLFYDTDISQAFGAALDDLFLNYPLEQGLKAFQKIVFSNPLVRFATSASPNATPSKIHARMEQELGSDCLNALPRRTNFNLKWLGVVYDYLNNYEFMDTKGKCPGYLLQPSGLKKQQAGALPDPSLLTRTLSLTYQVIDSVLDVTYHLITIPDAMSQSLSEIQNPVYNTQDNLAELEKQTDRIDTLSNIIDDKASFLLAGQKQNVADIQRHIAYFSCSSSEYSSPEETSILGYALGTRIGCNEATYSDSTCDGAAFKELLEAEGYPFGELLPKAVTAYQGMKERITPDLLKVYAEASAETGIPCEIFAGIHFVESAFEPNTSLISGRKLGTPEPDAGGAIYHSVFDTALHAGDELKRKMGGVIPANVEDMVIALSRRSGGGNSNCQTGYPFDIPYSGCPRLWEGEDDMYPVNWIDNKHDTMYLLYCADRTACEPQIWERPGALTFAVAMWQDMTKNGAIAEEVKNTPITPTDTIPQLDPGSTYAPLLPNASTTCGPNSLETALGCLPYGDTLASTILLFVIGLSGLTSLAVMLTGVLQIMTAAGDIEKARKGKELFTSAITGLLFIIFSVTLLKTIATDIIKLPGW